MTLLNPNTEKFQSFPLSQPSYFTHIPKFVSDAQGNTYFYHSNALFRFSETAGIQKIPQFIGSSRYLSFYIDRSNVFWVGTNGHGVHKFDLTANQFERYPYRANFHTDLFAEHLGVQVSHLPGFNNFDHAYYFRQTIDHQNHMLFNIGKGEFYQIDLQTKQLTKFPTPPRLDATSSKPAPLATDTHGGKWTVSESVLYRYNEQLRNWIPKLNLSMISSNIMEFVIDKQALWLATEMSGLLRVDGNTLAIHHYISQPGDTTSLSSNVLNCLSTDPLNPTILWIGTFGSGLCRFDKRTGKCHRFTTKDGLPNNVIYSVVPDRLGSLWLGTNKGLCRFNRQTFTIKNYTTEDGLMANEFNRYHILHLPNDRIFLGGIEGITAFNPALVKNDTFQPVVELTGLQINNKEIKPSATSLLGELPIHTLKELTLAHDQNYLNVEFAALQFNKEKKIKYRYRMIGLDKGWIVVNSPMAIYTDLKPGDYTLVINASNSSGIWSKYRRRLKIIIQPPFWATWWAYGLYGVLIVALIYGLLRAYTNRLRLKQFVILKQNEVELTIKEAQQLKDINEMKTRFFTNITHEFKTPLTLIMAPTNYLINELGQTKYARQLASIEQNSNQLLRLINQLLDLSKIEAKAMRVYESQGNPGIFIGQILDSFIELANQKDIQLIYQNQTTNDYVFDASLLERIIYNLVSNALKFTKEHGIVTVQLYASDGITVVVADNGVGIPPEKLASVFERFVQADASSTRQHEGTGIGLALVKELVDLQHGHIRIDSEVDPIKGQQGTTVTLQLPYRLVESAEPTSLPVMDIMANMTASQSGSAPIILLVEDNPEMATLIIDCLPAHYQFIWAKNGVEG
ncbi:hypothetical protein GO730_04140 [Spirosoma sp. HMF3257]|uniref:histidine kinase n=1 Tax=Spirosoma telluris TaxID=2183553 RepID=A0A327NF01_9BACT|nr:hypothetical protein [Spirosoma telluris]RAI73792.1 hypothetical protein HMF3257_04105 [Spirosoma telluris]